MEQGAVQAEQSESTSEDRSAPAESSGRRLFLGGLPWDTTKDHLLDHFNKFGVVEEAVIITERASGRPRGFGFVTFQEEAVAKQVCEKEHVFGDRTIDVKKSVPQENKPRSKKLFVGGLASSMTTEALTEYFGRFGAVADAQIMLDHQTKRSRGFGFITFADEAGAQAAIQAGTYHLLAGKQVEVKHALPRGPNPPAQTGPPEPGPGPGGGGVMFAPRPGFHGGYGGPAGHPGAYGAMGSYGPPMQYQAGPGYGMPGYGQAAFPSYSGLMVPHMGAYGFQPGYAYGHGGFGAQHMGSASGFEQQQHAAQQLPHGPPQGPLPFGAPGSSRHHAHPRLPPGDASRG